MLLALFLAVQAVLPAATTPETSVASPPASLRSAIRTVRCVDDIKEFKLGNVDPTKIDKEIRALSKYSAFSTYRLSVSGMQNVPRAIGYHLEFKQYEPQTYYIVVRYQGANLANAEQITFDVGGRKITAKKSFTDTVTSIGYGGIFKQNLRSGSPMIKQAYAISRDDFELIASQPAVGANGMIRSNEHYLERGGIGCPVEIYPAEFRHLKQTINL